MFEEGIEAMSAMSHGGLGDAPSVVSLFTGAGGLDIGLAAAGFRVVYESDIDGPSCETLRRNKGVARELGLEGLADGSVVEADARELSGAQIRADAGLSVVDEIDLLAGGPPCQAFSVFGRRGGKSDGRGMLSFEYGRLLAELRPKAFLFENVYGLLSIDDGMVFDEILKLLAAPDSDTKYDVSWTRVNARDYGVPQSRDRLMIFGVRTDLGVPAMNVRIEDFARFAPPNAESMDDVTSWRTVADALRGVPEVGADDAPPNHSGRKHSQGIQERYAALRPGERDSKTRINRLDLTRPSHTIVVGSDLGGGKGHVHPLEPRELTRRESARIQTFPDRWAFSGTVRDVIRQIGNAVPPVLGYAVGSALARDVFQRPVVEFEKAIEMMGQSHLFVR